MIADVPECFLSGQAGHRGSGGTEPNGGVRDAAATATKLELEPRHAECTPPRMPTINDGIPRGVPSLSIKVETIGCFDER
ncbi:MAG: hypothetical protein ACF788_12660 [Novipirellula sp. JB048]